MDVDLSRCTEWLSPERLMWSLRVLRIVMAAGAALLFLVFWRHRSRGAVREIRLPWRVTVVVAIALLVYQATWQLAGFRSVRLAGFMRRHAHRSETDLPHYHRGSIVDRTGSVLAGNAEQGEGRVYPQGAAAVHLVGYINAMYGLSGLEQCANPLLQGHGIESLEDARRVGRNMLSGKDVEGGELRLTLDAGVQREAYRLLEGRRGAVVVLDPRDGAVLACVSSPSYNSAQLGPGLFASKSAPMLNRALHGRYPPGSVFKVMMSALAVDAGLAGKRWCPAEGFRATPKSRPIRDHEYYSAKSRGRSWSGHGRIGLSQALAKSSNVYFAQLGVELGGDALVAGAKSFALGERVLLYRGLAGRISAYGGPFPVIEEGERRRAAQIAIGQGELVLTPMHVAMMASAIAADGELMRPRLVLNRRPEVIGQACSAHAAAVVRELMREVVLGGTGRAADIPGLEIAGKTGTAQAPGGADHSWFVCMAPVSSPTVVVAVLVERGGYGSASALPVAREVMRLCDSLGYVGKQGK